MSSFTQQTQAITIANTIISLAAQLLTLSQAITAANNAWQDNAVANTINALGTAPLNTDGSLGVADTTPNVAHPINVSVYQLMTRSLSANQIATLLTILNNIPTYVAGNAVSATGGVRSALNSASGS